MPIQIPNQMNALSKSSSSLGHFKGNQRVAGSRSRERDRDIRDMDGSQIWLS